MINEDDRKAIVLAKIRDAREMLAVAAINYQYEFYNSAVNRLYYACFHIASAALISIHIDDVKRHEGVRSMFSLHFIKGGRISAKWSSFYATMFSSRSNADYDNFKIYTKEQIDEMRPLVEEFVTMLIDYIRKEMNIEA